MPQQTDTGEERMTTAAPFLRWAGSKRKQAPRLATFWNSSYERYVEPFAGSACLFFSIQPKQALLSDINGDLITTFTAVRDHHRAVANRLHLLPKGKEAYYTIRQEGLSGLKPVDVAARFIYLNRYCFNGLYRTNSAGHFNVPYSPARVGHLATLEELAAASKVLQGATVTCSDFSDTLSTCQPGDFVYLDPPFAVGNRRMFRQYGPSSFGLEDINRLADHLLTLDSRGVGFALSYAHCKEALAAFGGWPKRHVYVQRNIAGFSQHRRRAGEVIFSNCFPPD